MLLLLLALCQDPDVERKLDARVSVDMAAKLDDLLDFVRASAKVNIVVDPRAGDRIDLARPVALTLKDVKARSIVAWISRLYGLDWATQDGAVVLGAPGQLEAGVKSRTFDVAGLIARPQDSPAPAILTPREGQPEFVRPYESPAPASPDDELVEIIRAVIAPGTWSDPFSAKVAQPGRITVRHHARVIAEVERLLAALKSLAPAMVTVEAELFETDADAERALESLASATLEEAAAKKTLDALKGVRASRAIEAFTFTCTEGQLTYMGANNPPGRTLAFEARPVLVPGNGVKVDLSLEGAFKDRAVAASSEMRFRTTTVIPNKGAAVFLLPRPGSDQRTAALIVRVSTVGGGATEAEVRGTADGPGELAKKFRDAAPIDVDVKDAPWAKLVDYIRQRTGLNFVLDPALADRAVTLKVSQLRPEVVLRLAMVPGSGGPWAEWDEAIFVGGAGLPRPYTELYIASVRDLALKPADSGERTDAASWEPDDVVASLRENVQRERWEDSLSSVARHTSNGLAILRHAPEVLAEAKAHLAEVRKREGRPAVVRAEIVTVPARAYEEAGSEYLVDEAAAAKLVAAATEAERVQLQGLGGVRIGLTWQRRRAPAEAKSTFDVRAETTAAGTQAALRCDAQNFVGATTSTWTASMRSTVTLPAGKAALFKLGLVEGGSVRLLVVRAR